MHDVSGRNAFRLHRNRRRNDAVSAVSAAQSIEVIDAIEQRNDGLHCLRLCDCLQGFLRLRGFYGDPQHIDRRNFSCARNRTWKFPNALSNRSFSG